MEGEQNLVINGINIRCVGYYGYNSHYYVTVYNDDNGSYIGQLVDCQLRDSNFKNRLQNFVDENVVVNA